MKIEKIKAAAFDAVKTEMETLLDEGFDMGDFPRFVEGVIALEERLEISVCPWEHMNMSADAQIKAMEAMMAEVQKELWEIDSSIIKLKDSIKVKEADANG